MKCLCIADIHGKGKKLPDLISSLKGEIDLAIIAGDITQGGGYDEAAKIIDPLFSIGVPFYAIPGNHDKPGVLSYLSDHRINLHEKAVNIGNIGIIGMGGSNLTPFHTHFEQEESEIKKGLEQTFALIKDSPFKILVSHVPPYNTNCDRGWSGAHFGSTAVSEFLTGFPINFCVCGHIHESAGTDRVGAAFCFNPGPFPSGKYTIVEILNNIVKIIRS